MLTYLAHFDGLAANLAVCLGIGIVFYYSIDYSMHPTHPRIPPVTSDWRKFPEFYGKKDVHHV